MFYSCAAIRKEHDWDYAGSYGNAGFDADQLLTDDTDRVVKFIAKYETWNKTERVYGDKDYKISVIVIDGDFAHVLCDDGSMVETWMTVDYDSDEFWDSREKADALWAEIELAGKILTDKQVLEYNKRKAELEKTEEERAAERARDERARLYFELHQEFGATAA